MGDVVEALRRGAWDFILKPVADIELLVRAVSRALEKAALQRQNRIYSESLRNTNRRLSSALNELRADEQAARQLQFQLLPADGLRVGSCSCFRRLFPSQVLSGDFLDYFLLGDRHLGFYVADVAGHGAASAFVTAILTTLVGKYREALTSRGDETILSPRQFLARLESDLLPHRLEKHITMFYGVLDTSSGHLVYGSAGAFPFPLLKKGADVIELECAGRPLNLPGRAGFGYGESFVPPGGQLLIASDGVLELEPKQTHREKRDALARITSESADLDAVLAGLGVRESTPLGDDVALLLVQRAPVIHPVDDLPPPREREEHVHSREESAHA
jgi:serine phosphatase RsbU (regulator of sigma subunit)